MQLVPGLLNKLSRNQWTLELPSGAENLIHRYVLKHAIVQEARQFGAQDVLVELSFVNWAHFQCLTVKFTDQYGECGTFEALEAHLIMVVLLNIKRLIVKYDHGVQGLTILEHISTHLLHLLLRFHMYDLA